jgi:hypothetical protein
MTLLTIAQGIADFTSGPRPASIASNTNPEAQNYLRIINKVSRKLMKIYAWNILRKEHTFTAPGAETLIASASMPSDFDRFVPETFWNRSGNTLLSGPISPAEWNGLKTYNPSINNTKFIYRGGDVLSIPTVGSGASCAFEYVSTEYVLATDGTTYKTSFTADTDTSLIDEELITLGATWEWLSSEGQPWQTAFQDFRDYFNVLQDNENATENIAVAADLFAQNSRHSTGTPAASRSQYLD